MFILGVVFCLAGVIMLFSSFVNITGFIVMENSSILVSRILSSAFLLIGMVFMLASRSLEEEVGTDVELHTIFLRHGEKDKKGKLTKRGEEQAREYGRTLEKADVTKAYGSSASRASRTAALAVANSPDAKRHYTKTVGGKKIQVRRASKLKDVRIRREVNMPGMSKEFINDWVKHAERGGADAAADWFYGLKGRYDKKTATAKEVAQGFAYMVQRNIRLSGKVKHGYRANLLNGTHQTCPESLLKEVMIRDVGGRKIRGFKKIKEIGGALDYTEPIDFKITRDDKGKSQVYVEFRDHEYDVDMERLNELGDAYAERTGKKYMGEKAKK